MKSFIFALVFTLATLSSFSQSNEVIVCKGKYSERYHSHICNGLNNCQAGLAKVTVNKAKEMGRTPCKICYGQTLSSARSDEPSFSGSNPGQCRATTKKGTQCSRSARSGGYCWQHGG